MAGVRVLIVDDEHLVRSGLRLMLDGVSGIDVVGEAANGEEALLRVGELDPDVVCLDIRMPVMDGVAVAKQLSGPQSPAVLMLTAFDTDGFLLDALEAGAVGFLLKDSPPNLILDAVLRAAERDPVFSPAVLNRLVALAGSRRRPDPDIATGLAALTAREEDVARAVAQGLTNAEIAQQLYLSLPTVKTHLGRVFDKLHVANRVQLALMVREGMPS
ncbi:MAG: response regulator [Arachnia sp.]